MQKYIRKGKSNLPPHGEVILFEITDAPIWKNWIFIVKKKQLKNQTNQDNWIILIHHYSPKRWFG